MLRNLFAILTLALRRIWHQRLLMSALLVGVTVSVGLLSSIPLYADAVQNRLLQGELTEAGTFRPPFAFLWRYVGVWNGEVTWEDYLPVNEYLTEQAPSILGLPIDEDAQIRHVATRKLRLFASAESGFGSQEPLIWTSVGFISSLDSQITIVEGSYPADGSVGDALPILVSQTTADLLGLQVGERYVLFGQGQDEAQIPLQLVGIWRPTDPSSDFWFYDPEALDEVLLTSEAAFVQQVVPLLALPVETAVWYQLYDGSRIRPAAVSRLLDGVRTVEARATALLNGVTLDASPVVALNVYGDSSSILTFTLGVYSLPVLLLVLYFVALVASMVVQRGQSEVAILRSRGVGRPQIVAVYLVEGLIIGALGLALGLLLGGALAQLMGRSRTFLDPAMLGPSDAPLGIVYSWQTFGYAALGILINLLALLFPALAISRHTIVTLRWQQARRLLAPLWQRYYLDLLLLIPPLYGWYQLRQQGTIAVLGSGNDPFNNPLLFLVPVLLCFAVGLLFFRFFPLLMGLLAWLAKWQSSPTLLLTLRQLARSSAQYMGPLLLLSLTMSLAAFTASMAITLDDHLWDQVYYGVGADLNIVELGESTEDPSQNQPGLPGQQQQQPDNSGEDEDEPRWLFLPVSSHLEVNGIAAAARVGRHEATARLGGRTRTGQLLGVDRLDFPQVAYFRRDFASGESLGGVMNRLAVAPDTLMVSRSFMAQQGLQVGDPLPLTVEAAGEFAEIEFTIGGPIDYFPTLYPQDGPFFVANLDYVHDGLGGQFPYDVWVRTEGETESLSSSAIVASVRELGIAVVSHRDAQETILREQTRPERQGLFGLLSVGFLSAAVLTVLGFLIYAIVSFQRRTIELGMLRAVGLSVTQMALFLTGELALLIFTGLGIGTLLGSWASTVFIPYFQVGDSVTALVPPFAVQVAWAQMGTIYLLFGLMFITAVFVLTLLVMRLRIFEAVKLGEAI